MKPTKKKSRKSRSSQRAVVTTATKRSGRARSFVTLNASGSGDGKGLKGAAAHEEFAHLVALGASQADAYRQVTGTKAKDKSVWESASRMAIKAASRIEELRRAAQEKATEKYVYEYEDAMREIDEALGIARGKNDAKAMTAAVALKAKLSGLETEARRNERPPFEGMSDDELVAGINRSMTEAGVTLQ